MIMDSTNKNVIVYSSGIFDHGVVVIVVLRDFLSCQSVFVILTHSP